MLVLFSVVLLLSGSSVLSAETPPKPPQPGDPISLTLHPMAVAAPALQHRLLPEVTEKIPGNAVVHYFRATLLLGKGLPEEKDIFWKLLNTPIDSLPREQARRIVQSYLNVYKELELAARSENCDWQHPQSLTEDGFNYLLPEIQKSRNFGTLLKFRVRTELADGNIEAAVRSLRTGFALARHVSESPTLISMLVGVAIGSIMAQQLDEFVQRPNAPNLYWVLTDLPRPLIDLRRGLQGERHLIRSLFPGLNATVLDPKSPPLTTAQVMESVEKLRQINFGAREDTQFLLLGSGILAAKLYPGARRSLLDTGRTPAQLDDMPIFQVVLMAELLQYDNYFDDMLKWCSLPLYQARPGLQSVEARLKAERASNGGTVAILVGLLLPTLSKVTEAPARVDRKVAALRCVEAIRLYAAAHDGRLPSALTDIVEVPIPLDPSTGERFEYRADGDRAILSAATPVGGNANNKLRYEIHMSR